MSAEQQEAVQVLSHVLPFHTNQFVLDHLIDWNRMSDDAAFRITFPQRDMLPAAEYARLRELVRFRKDDAAIAAAARAIGLRMQIASGRSAAHAVPDLAGRPQPGLQHPYRDSVHFFPNLLQSAHAHCTQGMRAGAHAVAALVAYLRIHHEVREVLIAGGDPLAMPAEALAACIAPLLSPDLAHVRSIRISTRSLACWPHRFVDAVDAGKLLQLFERVVGSGKRLSILGRYTHPVELRNDIAQQAVRAIVATGAELRLQGSLLRQVSDDPAHWAELWTTGIKLGATPCSLSLDAAAGPRDYFAVPLAQGHAVLAGARASVRGLAHGVRGPLMRVAGGELALDGIVHIDGDKLFALRFQQAHDPLWTRRPFYARFDSAATSVDALVPAFGAFPFETGAADTGTAGDKVVAIAARRAPARPTLLEVA